MADQTKEKVVRTAQSTGVDRRADSAAVFDLINKLTMRLRRQTLTNPVLGIGTSSAAKVKSTATIDFCIDGKYVRKSAAEYDVPAGAAMTNSTGAKEVWVGYTSVDGSAVSGVAGAVAASGLATKPAVPDDAALVGFAKIAAASNVTFTPGTTVLDATGITVTYEDRKWLDEELLKLEPVQ